MAASLPVFIFFIGDSLGNCPARQSIDFYVEPCGLVIGIQMYLEKKRSGLPCASPGTAMPFVAH